VWDTKESSTGLVEYGLTRELGQMAGENVAALHHEVQLIGLEPYTDYYYRVERGKVAKFRTAANSDRTDFRFVVFGDTRGSVSVHRAIINRMLDIAPDFVIHTGDLVESGKIKSEWDRFFRIEAPLLRTAPFYPTIGNHESFDPQVSDNKYQDIFHLPGNELWYAFDYGNARFICLKIDGNSKKNSYFPDEEQLIWLEKELAANDAPWLIVYFHIGVYTSREEGYLETGIREMLVPLFEKYDVDTVFMGHHHSYERIIKNGITYIVTGGGGAGLLSELSQPEPGSQVAILAHHFVEIEVKDELLIGRVIDRHGKVIDRFKIFADK
jgi:DNA repair exonuclease SbcCD nuclease subunit